MKTFQYLGKRHRPGPAMAELLWPFCLCMQRFGVEARSLRGLLRKGFWLLQLSSVGSRLYLYEGSVELTESCF